MEPGVEPGVEPEGEAEEWFRQEYMQEDSSHGLSVHSPSTSRSGAFWCVYRGFHGPPWFDG